MGYKIRQEKNHKEAKAMTCKKRFMNLFKGEYEIYHTAKEEE